MGYVSHMNYCREAVKGPVPWNKLYFIGARTEIQR
jgi:hypothetical protein